MFTKQIMTLRMLSYPCNTALASASAYILRASYRLVCRIYAPKILYICSENVILTICHLPAIVIVHIGVLLVPVIFASLYFLLYSLAFVFIKRLHHVL